MIWLETCKCICRLSASVSNNRQRWNEDKCRCECKELVDKGICDKGFIWTPSTCECESDKSYRIGEYLDYKSCVCRNTLIDRLVEDCTNVIDENKIYKETFNVIPLDTISSNDCASCTLNVVLFAVFLTTTVIISSVFIHFHWYSKKEENVSRVKFNPGNNNLLGAIINGKY